MAKILMKRWEDLHGKIICSHAMGTGNCMVSIITTDGHAIVFESEEGYERGDAEISICGPSNLTIFDKYELGLITHDEYKCMRERETIIKSVEKEAKERERYIKLKEKYGNE
ncbi:MAG: hypothetical protein OEX12_01120 [Gammaproteobacteria bacterium]|nr:hypothetical protein [Gammaproteobacteria bacterium]